MSTIFAHFALSFCPPPSHFYLLPDRTYFPSWLY
jgi:hypothetical protein